MSSPTRSFSDVLDSDNLLWTGEKLDDDVFTRLVINLAERENLVWRGRDLDDDVFIRELQEILQRSFSRYEASSAEQKLDPEILEKSFYQYAASYGKQKLHSSRITSSDEFDPEMVMCPFPSGEQLDTPGSRRKYDVFLSFRGEDTRASFTSHLYSSLQNSGIIAFKDDHSLQRGNRISKSLLEAIQESRISVIVFSKNYADSHWCLQELMQIMECHRTIGQLVLPVFYDVDPSQVRRQTGEFGQAFQNALNKLYKVDEFMVPKWRDSLRDAAGLAGFVVLNSRLLLFSLHFNVLLIILCIATSSSVIDYRPF
jgi:hypothetical protein